MFAIPGVNNLPLAGIIDSKRDILRFADMLTLFKQSLSEH